MAVISFPDSLGISRMRLELRQAGSVNDGPFGMQFNKTGSPRWVASIEGALNSQSESGDWKSLLLKLRGPTNQLAFHDVARPVPLGTLRGTLSFAVGAAVGDTSIQITSANDNLISQPEDFIHAAWTKSNVTVTSNAIAAPDGTLTADKLIGASGTSNRYAAGNAYTATNTPFVGYVFAKPGEYGRFRLNLTNFATDSRGVTFDVSTGTILSTDSNGADYTGISGAIELEDDGWYRCSIKATKGSVNSTTRLAIDPKNNAGASTGDGVSGMYFWGAKLQLGSTLTDYGYGKTLVKGDYLGFGSGLTQQVVMVTEDATSIGQGNITVSIEPPLRNDFSAGSAITWDRPKVLYRNQEMATGWDYESVFASGFNLNLIEDPRP